jgi:hypothetical protein
MSEQPQEWTRDFVQDLRFNAHDEDQAIADAHKAALAAEREKHARELLAKQTRIEIFQQQLAAEREKVKPLVDALKLVRRKIRIHTVTITERVARATQIINDALAKVKEEE